MEKQRQPPCPRAKESGAVERYFGRFCQVDAALGLNQLVLSLGFGLVTRAPSNPDCRFRVLWKLPCEASTLPHAEMEQAQAK